LKKLKNNCYCIEKPRAREKQLCMAGARGNPRKTCNFPLNSLLQIKVKLFLRDKPVVLDVSNDVAPLMPEDSLRVSIVNHGIIQLQDFGGIFRTDEIQLEIGLVTFSGLFSVD